MQNNASASCQNLDCQKELTLRSRPAWFGFKKYCFSCADRLKGDLKKDTLTEDLRQEYLEATQERKDHNQRNGFNDTSRAQKKVSSEPTGSAATSTFQTADVHKTTIPSSRTTPAQDIKPLIVEDLSAMQTDQPSTTVPATLVNHKRGRSVRPDVFDYEESEDDEPPPKTKRKRFASPELKNVSRLSSTTIAGDETPGPITADSSETQSSPTPLPIAELDARASPHPRKEELISLIKPSTPSTQLMNAAGNQRREDAPGPGATRTQCLAMRPDTVSANKDDADLEVLFLLNLDTEQRLFQDVVDQVKGKVTAAQSHWVKDKSRRITANEVLRRELVESKTEVRAMREERDQAIEEREQVMSERDSLEKELKDLREKVENASKVLGHTYD